MWKDDFAIGQAEMKAVYLLELCAVAACSSSVQLLQLTPME